MNLEKLNGLYIIGTLSKKYKQDYKDKEGNEKKSYKLKFDYMGGTFQVNCDDVIYTKVEEGVLYVIEVGVFTNKDIDFSIISTNKNKKIYEITGDNTITDLI